MKKDNIFSGVITVAVISVFALTAVFTCLNIVEKEEDISMYNNDPQKMAAENIPFSKYLKSIGSYSNNFLSEEISNNIYSNGSQLFKITTFSDTENITDTISDINVISEHLNGTSYFSIVPDASYIYSNEMPDSDISDKENDTMMYAVSFLDSKTKFINICNALNSSDSNYIFYRTDSMWTSEGAYCAYKRIIKKIGFTPTDFSDYNIIHLKSDYCGDLYNNSGFSNISPDCIDRYKTTMKTKILNVKKSDNENTYSNIYFEEYLYIKGKELCYYLGEPCSVIDIETNVNNNKSLLIIKDDYANEMIEFLSHHYKNITIVSPDLITENEIQNIRDNQYTDIIFLCGYQNAVEGTYFSKLSSYFENEQ